jgi:hypothetical protein
MRLSGAEIVQSLANRREASEIEPRREGEIRIKSCRGIGFFTLTYVY